MITKIKSLKSNLDLHKVKRKQLSIQFSLDGFSFCVFDLELLKFIVFETYTFKNTKKTPEELLQHIKQVFIAEALLLDEYERILVIHVNDLSTFVPKPLFDEKQLDTYIKYSNRTYSTDFYEYDSVLNQDMVSVFVPYVHINNFLIDQFGSFEYKHYSSILVEHILNHYTSKTDSLFIHVSKAHFEIIYGHQKKLILYNTFEYQNTDDFLYYILFTIEQLEIDVETIQVKLFGKISSNDAMFKALYNYVRQVSILEYQSKFDAILEIDTTIQRENFCIFNTIN